MIRTGTADCDRRHRAGARADRRHGAADAAGQARSRRDGPDIRLKLENLQPTNAYKIRGATNAVARLSRRGARARACGRSAPAMPGRASPMRRAQFGMPCTVVAIETAPQTKLDRMRALGATIVPVSYERAWQARGGACVPGLDGTFIHPFDNHDFIAGHGDDGARDPRGLRRTCARSSRDRRRRADHRRRQRDQGAAARRARCSARSRRRRRPMRLSLREGGPRKFADWQASFVDGAGGQERHRAHVGADAAGGRRRRSPSRSTRRATRCG